MTAEPALPPALERVSPSGIRAIANLAWTIPGALRLDLGEPDQPMAPHVAEALAQALAEGATRYGPTAGLPELRAAAAEKVTRVNGLGTDADRVSVTAGGVEGLFATYRALLTVGEEVLVPDPGWPNLANLARLLDAVPVGYPAGLLAAAELDTAPLDRLLTQATRAVVVNSPANPTGAVAEPETLRALLSWAARHGLTVIADECYDELWLDRPAPSAGAVAAGIDHPPTVVSVFSFSKTHSMTGLRLGYVVADETMTARVRRVQETVLSCVATPTQHAGLAALSGPQDHVERRRSAYRARRRLALGLLDGSQLQVAAVPAGAFYLWLRLPPGARSSTEEAVSLLTTHQVALAPGAAFGPAGEGHLRVSLAAGTDVIRAALGRLVQAFA